MNTNKPNSNKTWFIIGGVVVIAALVYFVMTGDTAPEDMSSFETQQYSEVDAVAGRVLSLLNQIESLRIDPTFFTGASYQTLRDYSVAIPPQNVGRVNPFAPIR
jgi:hypothetical protein